MKITLKNIAKVSLKDLPSQYRKTFGSVKKAVSEGLYSEDKEVKFIIDQLILQINSELNKETKTVPVSNKIKNSNSIKTLPIKEIKTDVKRFQNRKKLNQTIVDNIVDNFNETNLDPLIVWLDPKDDNYYILAGHHRFEALKKLKYKTVPVKIANKDYPTEFEAIRFAREESNANRSLEKPYERAEIYRKDRKNGMSAKEIEEKAKIEGRNKTFILNLSYLNDKGKLMQNLIQFDDSTSVQDTREIEKIADWIGQARRNYDILTDLHENEMFDFLKDKTSSKRTTNKMSFLQLVNSTISNLYFDEKDPLNLKRFKYESEGEKEYNNEVEDLKDQIKEAQNNIDLIKFRFLNPRSKNYINPNAKDYDLTKSIADEKIAEYNFSIKNLQSKLLVIYQNKSNYIDAGSNQGALFGARGPKGPKGMKSPVIRIKPNKNKSSKVISAKDNINPGDFNFYDVPGAVGDFLQRVERKEKDSVVITVDGKQGAGKTTMLYQFMDAFASGNNMCLFASLEQHPTSVLTQDLKDRYISQGNRSNIDLVGDFEDQKEFYSIIDHYDVIFIDSWQKLLEMIGKINLDKDLRKRFNGKVFVIVFQQTTEGRTKGGASIVFDGDIIIKMETGETFSENYAYFDKNRYTKVAIDKLRYNVAEQRLYDPTIGDGESCEPSETEFEYIEI
jgi:hypothetical protein